MCKLVLVAIAWTFFSVGASAERLTYTSPITGQTAGRPQLSCDLFSDNLAESYLRSINTHVEHVKECVENEKSVCRINAYRFSFYQTSWNRALTDSAALLQRMAECRPNDIEAISVAQKDVSEIHERFKSLIVK